MRSAQFLVTLSFLLGLVTARALSEEPTSTTSSLDIVTKTCACAATSLVGTTPRHCYPIKSFEGPKLPEWQETPCLCQPTSIEVLPGEWEQYVLID